MMVPRMTMRNIITTRDVIIINTVSSSSSRVIIIRILLAPRHLMDVSHQLPTRRSAFHERIVLILHIVCQLPAVEAGEDFHERIVPTLYTAERIAPTPLLLLIISRDNRIRRRVKRIGVIHDVSVPILPPVLDYIMMMNSGLNVLVRL
jgi:hypothetical protein